MPVIRINVRRALTNWMLRRGAGSPAVRLILAAAAARTGASLHFAGGTVDVRKGSRIIRLANKHLPYIPEMARQFDLYHGAVEAHEENGRDVVDFSRPALHRYRATGLEFELAAFPEEDELISAYFRWHAPSPGDTVYDLGAHCGVSAFELSRRVGRGGSVVCFEPDELNYQLLLRNVERHGLSNVICINSAIAASTGTASFAMEGAIGSALVRHASRAALAEIKDVPTVSLADAFARWGRPSFIKMDIEGSEVEVLKASRDLLRAIPVHFVLDTNHRFEEGGLTHAPVEKIFAEIGYQVESSTVRGAKTTWARPAVMQPDCCAIHTLESSR